MLQTTYSVDLKALLEHGRLEKRQKESVYSQEKNEDHATCKRRLLGKTQDCIDKTAAA